MFPFSLAAVYLHPSCCVVQQPVVQSCSLGRIHLHECPKLLQIQSAFERLILRLRWVVPCQQRVLLHRRGRDGVQLRGCCGEVWIRRGFWLRLREGHSGGCIRPRDLALNLFMSARNTRRQRSHVGYNVVQERAAFSRARCWQCWQAVTSPDVFIQLLYRVPELPVLFLEERHPADDVSGRQRLSFCSKERLRRSSIPQVTHVLAVVTQRVFRSTSIARMFPIAQYQGQKHDRLHPKRDHLPLSSSPGTGCMLASLAAWSFALRLGSLIGTWPLIYRIFRRMQQTPTERIFALNTCISVLCHNRSAKGFVRARVACFLK